MGNKQTHSVQRLLLNHLIPDYRLDVSFLSKRFSFGPKQAVRADSIGESFNLAYPG